MDSNLPLEMFYLTKTAMLCAVGLITWGWLMFLKVTKPRMIWRFGCLCSAGQFHRAASATKGAFMFRNIGATDSDVLE
jgi:hypothetical protein